MFVFVSLDSSLELTGCLYHRFFHLSFSRSFFYFLFCSSRCLDVWLLCLSQFTSIFLRQKLVTFIMGCYPLYFLSFFFAFHSISLSQYFNYTRILLFSFSLFLHFFPFFCLSIFYSHHVFTFLFLLIFAFLPIPPSVHIIFTPPEVQGESMKE